MMWMPPSKANGLTHGTFSVEFKNYLEKFHVLLVHVVVIIVGDLNIHNLDTHGFGAYKIC